MKLQNRIRLLIVGDIVGKGARNAFIAYLPALKEKYNYDILCVNAENTTHGNGLSYKHYQLYKKAGVDVLTMGNHTFGQKEIDDYITQSEGLVIPGNLINLSEKYDDYKEYILHWNHYKLRFVNLLGDYGMHLAHIPPLDYAKKLKENADDAILIVDYHAELTAEKNMMAYFLDGFASLVYGTHTHVQTADERILPGKCAFISDVGMCGSRDSIIGYDYQSFLAKVFEKKPSKVATSKPFMINAILVEIDLESKEAVSIVRIDENMV